MKKSLVILLVALVALALLAGCKNSPDTTKKGYTGKEYALGSTGPGGGIVFYDVDADNDSGNKDGLKSDDCGWRYLEVASQNANCNGQTKFYFCYNRDSAAGENKAIGVSSTAIGKGKDNTADIISKFANKIPYNNETGEAGSTFYAAYAATCYNGGSLTDWFLPSKEEALAMVNASEKITSLNLGDYVYWTSTEDSSAPTTKAVVVSATGMSGGYSEKDKSEDCYVRPVRRF